HSASCCISFILQVHLYLNVSFHEYYNFTCYLYSIRSISNTLIQVVFALLFASPACVGATLAVLMIVAFTFLGTLPTYIFTELDKRNIGISIAAQQSGGRIAYISAISVEANTCNH